MRAEHVTEQNGVTDEEEVEYTDVMHVDAVIGIVDGKADTTCTTEQEETYEVRHKKTDLGLCHCHNKRRMGATKTLRSVFS